MNWTLGLAQCETRFAILHDFDLYPLVPNYFTSMVDALQQRALRFTGVEWTHFDGLQSSHSLIGTWALAVDTAWLRATYSPIECFHAVELINGERFDLDAFTFIQSQTPQRDLVHTITEQHMAHVRNLVSTYLRFNKGELFDVVWRLHHMWYLESLCGRKERLSVLTDLMNRAKSSELRVDDMTIDYANTHVTCANVLHKELVRMETFLHGCVRPEVLEYVHSFECFLWRFGRSEPILAKDGSPEWSPDSRGETSKNIH